MADLRWTELNGGVIVDGSAIADNDVVAFVDVSDPAMHISGTDKPTDFTGLAKALATRIKMPIRQVNDVNTTVVPGDVVIAYNLLTAARSIVLPTAAAFGAGRPLIIVDLAGEASATLTLTVQRAGSDTISGSTSHLAVTTPYGVRQYLSDGVARWIVLS